EPPEIHDAGGWDPNLPQMVRDLPQVDPTLPWVRPHDPPVPVDAREDLAGQGIQGPERVQGVQGLRRGHDPLHIEHVAVQDLLRFVAARVEPNVASLREMASDVEIRI